MSKKKKEPTDWDALLKQQQTEREFTPEDLQRPGACALPPDHHDPVRGQRLRDKELPEVIAEALRGPKKDAKDK